MNSNKVGNFIKELREKKNWSQEVLADKLYCERTRINKIEKGKRNINIDDLILLSELFEISIEELIVGEKRKTENQSYIEITFKNYLKAQNTKIKRIRFAVIILMILLISVFSLFTSMYFFGNFKTIKIYRISGNTENYELNDGLLILSKDKIYLKIGNISPTVDEVSIYSVQNNKKTLIFKGNTDVILYDSYGYSSFISYKDFIKSKQKFFIVINGEKMNLDFKGDFINDKVFYKQIDKIGEGLIEKTKIPQKIKDSFKCEENSCHLDLEDSNLIFNNNILTVTKGDKNYLYDVDNSLLEYKNEQDSNQDFIVMISDNNISCISGNCSNSKVIYEEFYKSYVLKFLN